MVNRDQLQDCDAKRELVATGRDVYNLVPLLALFLALLAIHGNEPTQRVAMMVFAVHMVRVLAVHVWTWVEAERQARAWQEAHEEFERTKCPKCNGSGISSEGPGPFSDCRYCKGEGVRSLQALQ